MIAKNPKSSVSYVTKEYIVNVTGTDSLADGFSGTVILNSGDPFVLTIGTAYNNNEKMIRFVNKGNGVVTVSDGQNIVTINKGYFCAIVCDGATWYLCKPISENGPGASLPSGVIILWSGTLLTIPDGFVLCDGDNGTPDLTDKFIIGAGGVYDPADEGGSFSYTPEGSNSGMAVGNHIFTQPTFTGTPSTAIVNHTHQTTVNVGTTDGTYGTFDSSNTTPGTAKTLTSGNPVSGGVASYTPAGTNTLGAVDAHGNYTNPTFTGTEATIMPVYFALAYIMKT